MRSAGIARAPHADDHHTEHGIGIGGPEVAGGHEKAGAGQIEVFRNCRRLIWFIMDCGFVGVRTDPPRARVRQGTGPNTTAGIERPQSNPG
jgi:hypothetical protein